MAENRIITFPFIAGQMNGYGIYTGNGVAMDGTYEVPTEAWVSEKFSPALALNLETLGLSKWAAESWDCDKFASFAWVMARICHAQTPGHGKVALAFGMFEYYPKWMNNQLHMINFFFDEELSIRFYEPQSRLIIALTIEEIQSCVKWVI